MCSVHGWGRPGRYYTQMHQSYDIVEGSAFAMTYELFHGFLISNIVHYKQTLNFVIAYRKERIWGQV